MVSKSNMLAIKLIGSGFYKSHGLSGKEMLAFGGRSFFCHIVCPTLFRHVAIYGFSQKFYQPLV